MGKALMQNKAQLRKAGYGYIRVLPGNKNASPEEGIYYDFLVY